MPQEPRRFRVYGRKAGKGGPHARGRRGAGRRQYVRVYRRCVQRVDRDHPWRGEKEAGRRREAGRHRLPGRPLRRRISRAPARGRPLCGEGRLREHRASCRGEGLLQKLRAGRRPRVGRLPPEEGPDPAPDGLPEDPGGVQQPLQLLHDTFHQGAFAEPAAFMPSRRSSGSFSRGATGSST